MAQYEEITIDQGSDVAIQLDLVDHTGAAKSLVNHTVTAKMKKNYKSTDSADIQSFTSLVATPSNILQPPKALQVKSFNSGPRLKYGF